MARESQEERGLIVSLAVSDLFHEWILSLCLAVALAAVIAPLLLLFGLKFGTIDTLRQRLIQDPSNREIRPMSTIERDPAWFQTMAQRPEVAFVVPTTRQIAASVQVQPVQGSARVDVDLVPSAEGDPLLLQNATPVPKAGEVVLTALAAQTVGVRAGDRVIVTATRSHGATSERASVELKVVGTLSMRASGLKAVYAPLPFLEAVEAYKDGLAVPAFGWTGSQPVAAPEYDGAIVAIDETLSEERQLQLVVHTGFSKIQLMKGEGLAALAGWNLAPGHTVYWLSAGSATVREDSLAAARDALRGFHFQVFPWIRPLTVTVLNGTGKAAELPVQALTVSASDARRWGIVPAPPWGDAQNDPFQISLPESVPLQGQLTLSARHAGNRLNFPVHTVEGPAPPGPAALVPAALAGTLRLSETRRLHYDPASRQVLLERRNYTAFRMYARSLETVDSLRRQLADEGIPVYTEAQRIAEVTALDRHLTLIFLLIATVSVAGGIAVLVASLYASIQRKQRELGVLRLLGLSGGTLMRFPIYQALMVTTAGYGVASAGFGSIALTINTLFRSHLQPGEALCKLPALGQAASLSGALALATLGASLAAWRVRRGTAADALRDE